MSSFSSGVSAFLSSAWSSGDVMLYNDNPISSVCVNRMRIIKLVTHVLTQLIGQGILWFLPNFRKNFSVFLVSMGKPTLIQTCQQEKKKVSALLKAVGDRTWFWSNQFYWPLEEKKKGFYWVVGVKWGDLCKKKKFFQ